jgi:hypothetical protein
MTGRNDTCPCGSNRKYKHCHGAQGASPLDSVPSQSKGQGRPTGVDTAARNSVRQAIDKFPALAAEPWEVDIGALTSTVQDDRGGRPGFCIVCIGHIVAHIGVRVRPPNDLPGAAAWMLSCVAAAEKAAKIRPKSIRVRHQAVADVLTERTPFLCEAGALTNTDEAIKDMRGMSDAPPVVHAPWLVGSWSAWGLEPTVIRRIFDVSATFLNGRPWERLRDTDPILVWSRDCSWLVSVMGAGGITTGVSLYEQAQDYFLFATSDPDEGLNNLSGAVVTLTFDSKDTVPREMIREVRQQRWPLPAEDTYPVPVAMNLPAGVLDVSHLETLIDIMRYLPDAVTHWFGAKQPTRPMEWPQALETSTFSPPGEPQMSMSLTPLTSGSEFLVSSDPSQSSTASKPPKRFVTNMTHFLDEAGQLTEATSKRAKTLARFLGSIVTNYSMHQPEFLPCRRRRSRAACPGEIVILRLGEEDILEWICDWCGESGSISNWRTSPWYAAPNAITPRPLSVFYSSGALSHHELGDPDSSMHPSDWLDIDLIGLFGTLHVSWDGQRIPPELKEVIKVHHALELDGMYGSPDTADPIEHEELVIDLADGFVRIMVLNRTMLREEQVPELPRIAAILDVARRLLTEGATHSPS